MLATALLLRTVESLRLVFGGCVLGCGLKGEAVGKEVGSAMGSDDVARLGRGPVSTVRRRGPERARVYPCVLMKVMRVMKT